MRDLRRRKLDTTIESIKASGTSKGRMKARFGERDFGEFRRISCSAGSEFFISQWLGRKPMGIKGFSRYIYYVNAPNTTFQKFIPNFSNVYKVSHFSRPRREAHGHFRLLVCDAHLSLSTRVARSNNCVLFSRS